MNNEKRSGGMVLDKKGRQAQSPIGRGLPRGHPKRCSAQTHPERGSALVQTALVFPLLALLIFGFLLFLPALRAGAVLQMASREAARIYALTDDSAMAMERAKAELKLGLIDPQKAQITLERKGNQREAKIVMDYAITIPFLEGRVYKPNGHAVFQLETYH